jgi:hypothetical protein
LGSRKVFESEISLIIARMRDSRSAGETVQVLGAADGISEIDGTAVGFIDGVSVMTGGL